MALAKWYKVDFHTHSPASKCFGDRSVTAEQWVRAAKAASLDAVVLTDHNSVEFISKIDEVDETIREGIKIFYGIELCVSAEFTHILIVFDDKLSVQEIEDAVIGHLKLKREHWGDTTINVTEERLKELCQEMRNRIFVIPAHFASEKGLAKCSINAIKKYKEFVSFDAIEVRKEDDINEYQNKVSNGAINKAALITGSDNPSSRDQAVHSIEGFGSAFTWIKTSSLSFEGLRQVFLDPDNRCINMLSLKQIGMDFNPNEVTYNYVSGLILSNITHLTDLNMRFSPGLNCIVGGRGTGKSTIVDAIKYGLNCGRDLSTCTLLDKTMKSDGQITTYFNFGISRHYKVEAKREKKNLNFTYYNDDGEQQQPPEFKIDFYGQKEIYSLLEEDGNTTLEETSPLVKLIDDRIQSKLFVLNDNINATITELRNQATLYKQNCKRIAELPAIKAEVEKAEAIMERFKASGLEETRKKYELLHSWIKGTSENIDSYLAYLNSVITSFTRSRESYGLTLAKLKDDSELNQDSIAITERLLQSSDRVIDSLLEERSIAESLRDEYKVSSIHEKLEEFHREYLRAIESVKCTGSEEIQSVQDKLQANTERIKDIEGLIETQSERMEKIISLIGQLIRYKLELSEVRRSTIAEMHMEGIEFRISTMAHVMRFKSKLQKELKRDTFEEEFEKLATFLLDPRDDFAMLKKYYLFLLTSETGDLSEIGITGLNSRMISIWKEKSKNGTLDSLINVIPEDKVDISLVENGNVTDINEGSPGQKCAALLAFILNSGDNPLIIDQPEDDLDNSLIYNLVVKSIRKIKNRRQIIIVTHNPNIPVLGDAEGIIILERNSEGKVVFRENKKAGCIEEKVIRQGICNIMEGGEDAFRKREAKYLAFN